MFSDYNEIKLEIKNRRKFRKFTNMWKLNNMPLNNWWFKKEITRKIRKHSEIKENENTTCQNLWDAAESALKRNLCHRCSY